MSRRFLTAEDVRRASSNEIVVEEGTVVTPQAHEVAQSAGIEIRTVSGEYTEPAPDRGPDALLAQRTLPHLPEPEDEPRGGVGVVVTVVGVNRPGVLAEVTSALAELGANVDNVSQRMIDAYFHLVLTANLPDSEGFEQLKGSMERLGGDGDFVVRVMHERVFRYMHRV